MSEQGFEAMLEIEDVASTFEFRHAVTHALSAIDITIARGEFFVLLGPSGCGKTTMLRAIAGLQKPDRGTIRIGGEVVFSARDRVFVPPERRPIAMVFQSYAVWPHMNVFENIAFPLREGVQKLARGEIAARVAEVLDMLGLESVADRPVTMLSGGQQQRVALARALALRPKVLLMDEPLSNLDYNFQMRLRGELRELIERLHLTTVYVTHNQAEAIEMGDRIAVMSAGKLVQVGNAREIYHFPRDEFVARFIGDMNLIPATLERSEANRAVLRTAAGSFLVAGKENLPSMGAPCLLGIRPEDVALADDEREAANVFSGTVTRCRFSGEATHCTVTADALSLDVKLRRGANVVVGAAVRLLLPPDFCIVVDSQSAGARDALRPSEATAESVAGARAMEPLRLGQVKGSVA